MRPAVELINSSRNQYLLHHAAAGFGDVAEALVHAGDGVGEAQVIESEEVQQRGVEVVRRDFVERGFVAEVVGSDPVAAASLRHRERTASSSSRRLSSWTGSPISSRRRASIGTGITECLHRITSSGGP
jgi:hypothetical protein